MPNIAQIKLSAQESVFISAFLETNDRKYAVEAAGYLGDPHVVAAAVLRRPTVQAALHVETWRRIKTAAPLALTQIMELARSAKSETVKLRANETLLDRAGFIAPKAADADPDGNKPLSEMTPDELRDFISKGREQLEAKMMDVTPKPDNAALDAALDPQVIDMFS